MFPAKFHREYFDLVVQYSTTLPQKDFHYLVFKVSSLACSYGEPFGTAAQKFLPLCLTHGVLAIQNCLNLSFQGREKLGELIRHPDYLVRWCVLDKIQALRIYTTEDEKMFNEDSNLISQLVQDPHPRVSAYAHFLVKDRELDKAIWDLRNTQKLDPAKAALIKKMREHRKNPPLNFLDMLSKFSSVHPGDYTRTDVEKFVNSLPSP